MKAKRQRSEVKFYGLVLAPSMDNLPDDGKRISSLHLCRYRLLLTAHLVKFAPIVALGMTRIAPFLSVKSASAIR